MVFCDVPKAFDRVWHKGLIFKLKQLGLDGSLLDLISNYLDNRNNECFLNPLCQVSKVLLGWPGGAMVLGKLPVPGRPTNLD